jgi:hypothetical protein
MSRVVSGRTQYMLAFIATGRFWEITFEFLLEMGIDFRRTTCRAFDFSTTTEQSCFCTMDFHIINLEKRKDEDSVLSRNYWEMMGS